MDTDQKARWTQPQYGQQYVFDLNINQHKKTEIGKSITNPLLQLSVYLHYLAQKSELNEQEPQILLDQFKNKYQSLSSVNKIGFDAFLSSIQILGKTQILREQANVILLVVLGLIKQPYLSLKTYIEKIEQANLLDIDIDFLAAQLQNQKNSNTNYNEIKQGILLLLRFNLEGGGTNFMTLLSKQFDQQIKHQLYQTIFDQIKEKHIEKLEDQQLIAFKTQIQQNFDEQKRIEAALSFLGSFQSLNNFTKALKIFQDIFLVQKEQSNNQNFGEKQQTIQNQYTLQVSQLLNQKMGNIKISLEWISNFLKDFKSYDDNLKEVYIQSDLAKQIGNFINYITDIEHNQVEILVDILIDNFDKRLFKQVSDKVGVFRKIILNQRNLNWTLKKLLRLLNTALPVQEFQVLYSAYFDQRVYQYNKLADLIKDSITLIEDIKSDQDKNFLLEKIIKFIYQQKESRNKEEFQFLEDISRAESKQFSKAYSQVFRKEILQEKIRKDNQFHFKYLYMMTEK